MNKIFTILGVLLISSTTYSQNAIEKLQNTLPGAAIGINVVNLNSDQTIMQLNANIAFSPASITKLISTVLAFEKKGISYTFETPILYSGEIQNGILHGNIIICAQGDPCFNSKYFPNHNLNKLILNHLKSNGITRIKGKILIENNLYNESLSIPGSWTWEDLGNYYGAAYHLFNYHDNSFTLTFASQSLGNKVIIKSVEPEIPNVEFLNSVTAKGNRDNAYIYGSPLSHKLQLVGTIPPNRKSFKIRGTLFRPDEVFINSIAHTLSMQSIVIEGNDYRSYPTHLLCKATSPTFEEIAYQTNKISINLFAEALGQTAVKDFCQNVNTELNALHIDTVGIKLYDACGLSPFDAVPPRAFTQLLQYAHGHFGSIFINTLPIAGFDYALSPYLPSPILIGKVKAKTGSFSGVRCLCGYLTTNNGETLAFCVMVNHFTCDNATTSKAIGTFLESLLSL